MRRVTIVHTRLTGYRTELFDRLRNRATDRGIEITLVHGQPSRLDALRRDGGHLAWADEINNVYLRVFGKELVWQRLPRGVRRSDLVILTQENRILSNYPLLLLPRRGLKVAFWGHGVNFQSKAPTGIRERWKRLLLTRVDWWFAYTAMTVDLLRSHGYPAGRITCLNNAIDNATFLRELKTVTDDELREFRSRHGIGERAPVGLLCSSLYPEKRLDFLVSAADRIRAALPAFHLVVIGDGPSAPWLSEQFRTRPWAHWLGSLRGSEKAAYFRLASAILNPGLVGLHLLDAFCAGLPLFSTRGARHSPEVAYLVDGENGFLTADEPEEYAAAVVSLLNDDQRKHQVSEAARSGCDRYSLDNMVENFLEGVVVCLDST